MRMFLLFLKKIYRLSVSLCQSFITILKSETVNLWSHKYDEFRFYTASNENGCHVRILLLISAAYMIHQNFHYIFEVRNNLGAMLTEEVAMTSKARSFYLQDSEKVIYHLFSGMKIFRLLVAHANLCYFIHFQPILGHFCQFQSLSPLMKMHSQICILETASSYKILLIWRRILIHISIFQL